MKRLSVETIAGNKNYLPVEISNGFILVRTCSPKEIFCHDSVSI
jgi:hypothetical protein